MDNQEMNFGFEPVQEPVQQEEHTEPAPQPAEPAFQPPETNPRPAPQPYTPNPYAYTYYGKPEKEKKDHSTGKIIALVLVVALVASFLGAMLKGAVDMIADRDEDEDTSMADRKDRTSKDDDEDAEEEDDVSYELREHELPKELSTNDTGKALSPAQVYELTVNSVVGIQTEATMNAFGQEAVSASAGSGFILSEDGYVITNCHVVAGADKITVDLFNGDSFPAELVGSDSSFDIAVLKIDAKGLPAVSVGDSDQLKVGEEVVAIGNPLGELTFTMTNGILSALDREINTDGNPQNMLQTNAAINSGNSGGPLFDMDGNVIGVTTAKYSGSTTTGTTIEGLGFAIPINEALKVAYDLVDYGYVKGQAYLGVTVATLDSRTASYYGLPIGPRVESVNPGSCAEAAGIEVGDIITACDGVKVESNPELLAQLKKHKAGETITMDLFRAGEETQVTVTLDEKPSQEEIDATVQQQEQEEAFPEEYYYQYPDGFFN